MSCCCCCDSLPQSQLPELTQELTREQVNEMNDADRVNYCYQLSTKKLKEHHNHDHEKLSCFELLVEVMDFVSSVSRFGSASYLWERSENADIHLKNVISGLMTLLSEEEWNQKDANKVIESAKDWHFSSLSSDMSARLYSGDVSVLDEVKELSQQYHPELLQEAVIEATNAPNGNENELFNDERFKRAFKSYKMNPVVKPFLSKCDAVFRVAHEPISDRLINYTKRHVNDFVCE